MARELKYMTGFGNTFESEALAGALPIGRNSPQKVAFGLYTEQLSGSPFTAPQHENERSWLYRIRPSVRHMDEYRRIDAGLLRTAPPPGPPDVLAQMRWNPEPLNKPGRTFVSGLRTYTVAGDHAGHSGMAAHVATVTASMKDEYFFNADGELLIVMQQGKLIFHTEFGIIDLAPGEICVIPRGVVFKAVLPSGTSARAYVCENYGGKLTLPNRGPIGANCLANPRDFETPVACYEEKDRPARMLVKWYGALYEAEIDSSPLDVVAWHGNYAPYKYDLRRFSPVNAVSFDHPDPSIFTVLTSPTETEGTANIDFVIFPERWSVAENTFRPPWYHRNIMSEFMGLIYGVYDAKPQGFKPGCISLHNRMLPHGPDRDAYDKAISEPQVPVKMKNTLAFMFESLSPQMATEYATDAPTRQRDYVACWSSLRKNFRKTKKRTGSRK